MNGGGRSHLCPDVEAVVAEVVRRCVAEPVTGADAHRLALRELARRSLGYVGYAAFMRRWNAALAARGRSAQAAPTGGGVVCAVAHAPVDLMVVDRCGRPIGRPLLTTYLCIDVDGPRPFVRTARTELSFPGEPIDEGVDDSPRHSPRAGSRSRSGVHAPVRSWPARETMPDGSPDLTASATDWSMRDLEDAVARAFSGGSGRNRTAGVRAFERHCDLTGRPTVDRRIVLAVARSQEADRRHHLPPPLGARA